MESESTGCSWEPLLAGPRGMQKECETEFLSALHLVEHSEQPKGPL